MHQMHRAHHKKTAFVVAGGEVKLCLPRQRKSRARRKRAHRAGADMGFLAGLKRLQLVVGDALALFARLVRVGAWRVAADQRRAVADIGAGGADGRLSSER